MSDSAFLECLRGQFLQVVKSAADSAFKTIKPGNIQALKNYGSLLQLSQTVSKINLEAENAVSELLSALEKINNAHLFQLEYDGKKLSSNDVIMRLQAMTHPKKPCTVGELTKKVSLLCWVVKAQWDQAQTSPIISASRELVNQAWSAQYMLSQFIRFLNDVKKGQLSADGQAVVDSINDHIESYTKRGDLNKNPTAAVFQMIESFKSKGRTPHATTFFPNVSDSPSQSHRAPLSTIPSQSTVLGTCTK